VRLKLDDDIVLATDTKGNQTLRLEIEVNGQAVTYQFPTLNQWNSYVNDLARMYKAMALSADNIEQPADIDQLLNDPIELKKYAEIMRIVIMTRMVRPLITKIFFKYLKPQADGKRLSKRWLKNNLPIDTLFKVFTGILWVDEWLKKNARSQLQMMDPNSMLLPSSDTSPKNMDTPLETSKTAPSSSFVTF